MKIFQRTHCASDPSFCWEFLSGDIFPGFLLSYGFRDGFGFSSANGVTREAHRGFPSCIAFGFGF